MSEQPNLDEIRARCEAATEGPWDSIYYAAPCRMVTTESPNFKWRKIANTSVSLNGEADAEFIAHARTDIPALLALVARLAARVAELEAQIETLTKERDAALVDAVPTRRLRQAIESMNGPALWLSQKDFIAALLASPRPSPRPKRVKGPRSKPNELRARIRREAHLAARTWNEVNGECSVAYRLDGMTAWGYAYCLREDAFDLFFGMELVYRRALEALEDGLRQRMAMGTGSYHSGELRSMEMDLPLWSWSDDDKAGKTP